MSADTTSRTREHSGADTAGQSRRAWPLGSCIHRGGETRRTGADDDHVVNLVRVDRSDEADATGERDIAGVAQQLSVGTENDRQFASVDMKALDQRLCARIGLWV